MSITITIIGRKERSTAYEMRGRMSTNEYEYEHEYELHMIPIVNLLTAFFSGTH